MKPGNGGLCEIHRTLSSLIQARIKSTVIREQNDAVHTLINDREN